MTRRQALLRLEVPFGMFGASLIVLAFVFAVTGIPSWIPAAPMVRLGVPSPLTGMTRSFVGLASGDVRAAFAWHPLGPVVFAACVAMPLLAIVSWARGDRSERVSRLMRARPCWIGLTLLVAMAWARQIATFG